MVPEITSKTILDNGLTILTSKNSYSDSVSICLFVKVGSRYETIQNTGISHMVEHMLFKGTFKRPKPYQIASEIETTGGFIDATTEPEYTAYAIRIEKSKLKNAIDILFDMILNPLFDPDSIQTERFVILEELSMINDSPTSRADMLLTSLLWENHPLGTEVVGSKKTLQSIDRSQLLQQLNSYYLPNRTILSIAGNANHEEIVSHIENLSKNWRESNPRTFHRFKHTQRSPKIKTEHRKIEQSQLTLGFCHPNFCTSDTYFQDIINVILGGSMSSKLFVNIRELNGFAYDIHSDLINFTETGALVISAGIQPKKLYDALSQILDQISNFSHSLTDEDISKAKQLITGRLMLDEENTNSVAYRIGHESLLLEKAETLQEIIYKINNIQLNDLRNFLGQVFKKTNLNLAIVGQNRGLRKLSSIVENFS